MMLEKKVSSLKLNVLHYTDTFKYEGEPMVVMKLLKNVGSRLCIQILVSPAGHWATIKTLRCNVTDCVEEDCTLILNMDNIVTSVT